MSNLEVVIDANQGFHLTYPILTIYGRLNCVLGLGRLVFVVYRLGRICTVFRVSRYIRQRYGVRARFYSTTEFTISTLIVNYWLGNRGDMTVYRGDH